MIALPDVAAEVGRTDPVAAAQARSHAHPGRLTALARWLAATHGRFPPNPTMRVRYVTVGAAARPALVELAATLDIGIRSLDATAGLAEGSAAADTEAELGTDLVVLTAHDTSVAAAVAVAVLTGSEPVALLPRGADAVDTGRWVSRAGAIRDLRRKVSALQERPGELLDALGSPPLAAAAGFALRAAARRTALVLDGAGALAAALICAAVQPHAIDWWQVTGSASDPVQRLAAQRLGRQPLLDLGAEQDGFAGLLAVPQLRAAALMAGS